MESTSQLDLSHQVQIEIGHLLEQLRAAGINMRLVGNAEAYLRIAESLGCWVDPACAQQTGGVDASPFWLEFIDGDGMVIAIGAAFHCRADDIIPLIATGHMWYPGGFADYCALHALVLSEPSRLVGQSFSYQQLALNIHAETPQTFIAQMGLTLQALAFRHHSSRFAAMLGVHSPEVTGAPHLFDCYQTEDFLASTYFPPAEARATLTLLSSRVEEFLAIAAERRGEKPKQRQTRAAATSDS